MQARATGRCTNHTPAVLMMAGVFASALLVSAPATAGGGSLPVSVSPNDLYQRGTQPGGLDPNHGMVSAPGNCLFCHSGYDLDAEPYRPWSASMMGQSARDPMFWACLTVANQDATGAGSFCIRCHIPNAFVEDRDAPDGSELIPQDFESVNCNFCHRIVNPAFPTPGDGPVEDDTILGDMDLLDLIPANGSNARYILDPMDSRRGPFDDIPSNPHNPTPILVSPFHSQAEFCWTCHDVSNMLFRRQPDDTYDLELGGVIGHDTGAQEDMFPLHRTYGEWKNSYYFTLGGVQHNGRFGGNHPTGVMHTCQDCHMPDQIGKGCGLPAFAERPDVPQHSFAGSNTWGLKAVRTVDADGDDIPDFPDSQTGLSDETVNAQIARNTDLLEKATDLFLTQIGEDMRVRIINQTGHKVPTGFPDGRRMWVNVKFLDVLDQVAVEHGEFDFGTGAIVNPQDTTVFEIKLGLDAAQASATGLPEGDTFHFVLANVISKDNRIPPRGFSNTVAAQNQTGHVGATYSDGQHWSDTLFAIPGCATQAVVTVYYQLVSDEYITFLRDSNVTDNRGQVVFDLWSDPAVGNNGAPVVMDMATLVLPGNPADLDDDGIVGINDLLLLLANWGPCPQSGACIGDLDCDADVGINDFLAILALWSS